MNAQRISSEAPILCHPAVVFAINYFLIVVVIVTDYQLIAIVAALTIGLGFIALASVLRDIDIDDKQMFIGGRFVRNRVVDLKNIRYITKGTMHNGSYDIIYIDGNGKNQSATFYPIVDEEFNIIEPAVSFLERYKS